MSTFNDHLLRIHDKISVKDEDRAPYIEMAELVKDWLMTEMCLLDNEFEELCKGTEVFDKHPDREQPAKPNEFDIFLLFDFPIKLKLKAMYHFPGYVSIRSKKTWRKKSNSILYGFEYMFQVEKLQRNRFQNWLQDTIEHVLCERPPPNGYKISYKREFVAQNICVRDTRLPSRIISIDFIPAIVLPKKFVETLVKRRGKTFENCNYIQNFLAIPKTILNCGTKNSRPYTFQLVNPVAERVIWNKENVKAAFCLLKSLRDKHKLSRLNSDIFTSIFLNELIDKSPGYWQESLGTTLLHMLHLLLRGFQNRSIPFYWEPHFDLLNTLKPLEITVYTDILFDAYNRLKEFSLNKTEFDAVAALFQTKYT